MDKQAPFEKIQVAVLGASGSVGQRFVQLLDQHPWFRITALAGSGRSVGQVYEQACHWLLEQPMPDWAKEMVVQPVSPDGIQAQIVFSALPSELAQQVEPEFAKAGMAVCSNASAFRQEQDVPLLLPEVNPDHIELVQAQRQKRGWRGFIITNPNCTSTGLTIALKALQDAFGLQRVFAVSLQALSGAGFPGVASLDIIDNVLPYIENEEDKVEWEPRKMLGNYEDGEVIMAGLRISAHTNRVAVSDGHLVCVSLELAQPAGLEGATTVLRQFQPPPASQDLPSMPRPVIVVCDQPNRPQPRLDRLVGRGMSTVVGRIRTDPLFHLKFVVLSHNTIRGAAGGSILNAELLVSEGLL